MNIANLLKIALKALNNNKLRCFLTMLGIIIGVASVITMLAIGQGSKNSIKEQISEMGSNMIMIHPGNMHRGGVRQSADDMQTLDESDYEALKDLPGIAAVSPSVNSGGQLVMVTTIILRQSTESHRSILIYADSRSRKARFSQSMTLNPLPKSAFLARRWLTIYFLMAKIR